MSEKVVSTKHGLTLYLLQFSHSGSSPRRSVNCSREVILAAGAIFSPTILQLSGIGPEDVLKSLDVPVRVDLPGVGANLQDHGMLHPVYSCTSRLPQVILGLFPIFISLKAMLLLETS